MKYRTERNGSLITLWDDGEGVGLQFKEGETLQGYTSGIVLRDEGILNTEEGIAHLSEVEARLTAYAEAHFPREFSPLKIDQAD